MNRCPITYLECGLNKYSEKGLRMLSQTLPHLKDFPYSAERQRREAVIRAGKMSIQGVQPKLSAKLNVKAAVFEVVDKGGRYVLKPQHATYPELPENEDLTMRLASLANIEVPLHGLIYCEDGSLTYFIKRFDRVGRNEKLAIEDFAQLAERDRDTKYQYSMEQLVSLLDRCTFPMLERAKLFKRCIFNYLIGNEDMHLKNFSLIRRDSKIELSPAYDFLNTTIAYMALGKTLREIEEIALPLKGKKRTLTRAIWTDYFAVERLNLNNKTINDILSRLSNALSEWKAVINASFLSEEMRARYLDLLEQRSHILDIA